MDGVLLKSKKGAWDMKGDSFDRQSSKHALIVGYLALLVALGGTAVAATKLAPDSVGSRQLRTGAVTNPAVRAGSLTLDRFSRAARQALGAAGHLDVVTATEPLTPPSCPQGCSGLSPSPAGTSAAVVAKCPAGYVVIAGGYAMGPNRELDTAVTRTAPSADSRGWEVSVALTKESALPPTVAVTAVCVSPTTERVR